MDICHWNVFTTTESIPFRWIIIVMIYMATIILSLSAESFDDRIYAKNVNLSSVQKEMVNNFFIYLNYLLLTIYLLYRCTFVHSKISNDIESNTFIY